MNIHLKLINQSNADNDWAFVVFQQNQASNHANAIAWNVFDHLVKGASHSFAYSMAFEVTANTPASGLFFEPCEIENGESYEVALMPYGYELRPSDTPAAKPNQIELWNKLSAGAIDALIFSNGHLLAKTINVASGSKAIFWFPPKLFIGALPQIQQGDVIPPLAHADKPTELDLQGITSADIVVTGGGSDPNATPFKFTLSNIS